MAVSGLCRWIDDRRFSLASHTLFEVGDSLVLRPNSTLKAKCIGVSDLSSCDDWQSSPSRSVVIAPPSPLPIPLVNIAAPSTIGACDSLEIDLSGSTGSAGRRFNLPSFQVMEREADSFLPHPLLAAFLSSNHTLASPFTVPAHFFRPGSSYNISVRICNFLNGCSESSHEVFVSRSGVVPIVSINSNKIRSTKKLSRVLVSGRASPNTCAGDLSSGWVYSWEMYPRDVSSPSSFFQSTSKDPRTFLLPAYSLDPGVSYTLIFRAFHPKSDLLSASAPITVTVVRGDVVAKIAGSSEKLLPADGSVSIDASGSYDEDEDPAADQSSLLFSFSCRQLRPFYNPSCLLHFDFANSSFSSTSVARVSIGFRSSVSVDSVHEVTVSVQQPYDGRLSSVTAQVTVIASSAPLVSIQSETGLRINPSQKLKLFGEITSRSSGRATWSLDDPSISIVDRSLSPVSRILPGPDADSSSRISLINLVLSPDTLTQGGTFKFTLTCVLAPGSSSSSSILITTNSPPSSGQYWASPSSGGRMLETLYIFVASQWTDEDLPLTYEFLFESLSGSYLIHRSRLETPHSSSLLPGGPTNLLTTRVKVFDALDSQASEDYSVEVLEVEMSTESKVAYLASLFSSSEGDVDELSRAISLGSSLLNSVNCSVPLECKEQNRHSCRATPHTCGECLFGFFGEVGDANSLCLSTSLTHRRQLSERGPCTDDADCYGGGWEVCRHETGHCEVASKKCPNNCSGHGRPVFFSRSGFNATLPSCSVFEVDCECRCECDEGFHGISCHLLTQEYEQILATKHQLVKALEEVSELQEVSASSILSWLARLSSVSSEPSSLEHATKMLMANMTRRYLEAARVLRVSYEDISAVGTILDLLLDARFVSSSKEAAEIVVSLLERYNDFISSDLVVGQNPATILNRQFRISHYSLDQRTNTLSEVSLSPPKSALEDFTGYPSQVVNLSSVAGMKVSVLESLFLPFNGSNAMLRSVPIELRFSADPCSPSSSSASLQTPNCIALLTLRKSHSSLLTNQSSRSSDLMLEVTCGTGDYSDHDLVCPDGTLVTLSCKGEAGVMTRQCSIHNSTNVCSSLSGRQPCRVLSEGTDTITCECSMSNVTTEGRVAESGSTSVTMDFGVIALSLSHDFLATWKSADDLTLAEVTNNLTVLFSTIGVAFIGAFVMFLSWKLDKRDQQAAMSKNAKELINNSGLRPTRPSLFDQSLSYIRRATSLTNRSVQPTPGVLTARVKKYPKRRQAMTKKNVNVIGLIEEKRIEESLPLVMRPMPFSEKCKSEIKLYHRWLGVYFHYTPAYARPLRVLSLWVNIVLMLFIQSVLYNLSDPDDGSCERENTPQGCSRIKSSLSKGQQCSWSSESEVCSFRPIDQDFDRVLIVAVLSGILSAPFSIGFQSLILFVISAETRASDLALPGVGLDRQRSRRTISNQTSVRSQVVSKDCLSTSLQDDLSRLFQRIRCYRSGLTPEQREEFECMFALCLSVSLSLSLDLSLFLFLPDAWGEVEPNQNHDSTAVSQSNRSILFIPFLQELSRAYARLFSQRSPLENLLLELRNVRKIVSREASYFQNPLVDEEQKRKRLNFLFVKDLLDGVNGMILDHKDRRDNEFVTHQVDLGYKVFGCFVLFVSSFGMLCYVYLFSMRQSASRQRAWFNSFQVWFFFEVAVISTGLVLVEHVLIPLWSLREVQRVKERIVSDILTFQKKVKKMNKSGGGGEPTEDSKPGVATDTDPEQSSFNAAEFFYVSHRLAALFPDHPESALILRYKTPWPKKSFKHDEKSMRKRYDKRFEFVTKTVTRIALFALSSIVQLPPSFQDMGLQVLLFAIWGAIVRFHLRLLAINPFLVLVPSLVALVVVYVLFVSGRRVRNLIFPTYPLAEEEDQIEEDTTGKGKQKGKSEQERDEEKEKESDELVSMRHIAVVALSRESQAYEDLSLAEQMLEKISSPSASSAPSTSSSEEEKEDSSSSSGSALLCVEDWAALGRESSSESSVDIVWFQVDRESESASR